MKILRPAPMLPSDQRHAGISRGGFTGEVFEDVKARDAGNTSEALRHVPLAPPAGRRPTGRPCKLSKEKQADFVAQVVAGAPFKKLCGELHLSLETGYRYLRAAGYRWGITRLKKGEKNEN